MSKAKKLLSLFLATLLMISAASISVYAEEPANEIDAPTTGTPSPVIGYGQGIYDFGNEDGIASQADNLINRVSLTIAQVDNRGLRVNFATGAVTTMAEIGGKDITIQRWENNKWVTICKGESIAKDVFFYSGSYYSPLNLPAGYYYRATILHYAKEQGWFFPSKQEFFNETNYILLQ